MTMRIVEVDDLFDWLPRHEGRGPVVTSLPDAEELGLDHDTWADWYYNAARACFSVKCGFGPSL